MLSACSADTSLCTVGGSITECGEVTGVVTVVNGPSVAVVNDFMLHTTTGVWLDFLVQRLDLTNGGQNAPHLRDHLVTGVPIVVQFKVDGGQRYALRYFDALGPTGAASASG